ncbi:MAG: GYDIA family GHMP kinase [Bernardetiaceae bacterium]
MNHYHGNGKLLLSGEYFVLDGALALALPTQQGQRLKVTYAPSPHKVLHWKSYDSDGNLWFEAVFDIETFECLEEYVSKKSLLLQRILQAARRLGKNFLKGKEHVLVETYLEFPRLWGLGTSSTLIHNISRWAGINPFELLFRTLGGSGYDIACAESEGPILYQKTADNRGPYACPVAFDPPFKDQLYFVYLGKKQSSAEGIAYYRNHTEGREEIVREVSEITKQLLKVQLIKPFEGLIRKHEEIVASALKMRRVKDIYFADYWGEIKSLGAWGGDFILVTSDRDREETRRYFLNRGFATFLAYQEMIRDPRSIQTKQEKMAMS